MKKTFKIFAVAAAVLALAACNHKAEFTTDSFVRFDVTSLSFDEDAGSATIAVRAYPQDGAPSTNVYFECTPSTDGNRNSVEAEYGTDYTVSPADGVLSFYGDSTQYITIYPVQFEDFVTGDRCFNVTLTGADNGYRLAANYEVFVKIRDLESNESWVSLGMCKYTEDFMTTFWAVDNVTYEVEIEEEENTPGWFRLVYPYDGKYPYNDNWETAPDYYEPGEADWDLENIHYMEIHAEDPNGVYIPMHDSGMDWGYGNHLMWSMADYYYEMGGYSREEIQEAGYCGTYKNGVITFPTGALLITDEADWIYEYLWYANLNGAFKVVMPGVVLGDFTVSIDYAGKFTSTDDENFAVAAVDFEGKDIAYARVAMAEGRDYETLIDSLKVGTVDYVEITESGNVAFPCEESGNYTMAVVSYSSDNEVGDSDYVTFKFTVGSGESWSLYGTGNYSYSGFYLGGTQKGLELYQDDSNPNNFKITNWAAGTDFCFTWDQASNEIYVEDQYTGYDYSFYGAVNIRDVSDNDSYGLVSYGSTSFYSDGVFNFAVQYYCSGGSFGFGFETFTLNGASHLALSDAVGTFNAFEYSAGYGYIWGNMEYVLAESDDPTQGNIMFTVFDGYDCDQGYIYGTYDEETGIAEFECDQLFAYDEGYYIAASLYELYEECPITFRVFNNGDIWGPFYGDYLSEDAYMSMFGSFIYMGWWDELLYVYGHAVGTEPNSIKPASNVPSVKERPERTEPFDKSKIAKKTIDHQPIPAVKNDAASRYNFVPTKEVKAKVIDKTQRRTDIQQVSSEMK